MTSRVARYVSRRLERRGRHEAELDASRVVYAGSTSIPNIHTDLKPYLPYVQRRLPAVVAYALRELE